MNENATMDNQLSNRINSMYANQTLEKVRKIQCCRVRDVNVARFASSDSHKPWRLW